MTLLSAPRAGFTAPANDPSLALFAAQAAGVTGDELRVLAEPFILAQTVSGDEMDQLPAGESRVNVFDHAVDPGTLPDALVFPESKEARSCRP